MAEFPTKALSDDACFICGSDLKNLSTGLKGRLNHLKRCAKKYGVSARDVKLNDDSELFVVGGYAKPAANDDDNSFLAQEWHEDAATDLALANHDQGSSFIHDENIANQKMPATTKSATKQTTMGNFFKMPVRSLNNVLLAGAKRVAKSTELLTANKNADGSNGQIKSERELTIPRYSMTACLCSWLQSIGFSCALTLWHHRFSSLVRSTKRFLEPTLFVTVSCMQRAP